jgi:hypothetical protein
MQTEPALSMIILPSSRFSSNMDLLPIVIEMTLPSGKTRVSKLRSSKSYRGEASRRSLELLFHGRFILEYLLWLRGLLRLDKLMLRRRNSSRLVETPSNGCEDSRINFSACLFSLDSVSRQVSQQLQRQRIIHPVRCPQSTHTPANATPRLLSRPLQRSCCTVSCTRRSPPAYTRCAIVGDLAAEEFSLHTYNVTYV